MQSLDFSLRWCLVALLSMSGLVAAERYDLSVVLINDTEPGFNELSAERNMGFRLGVEWATRAQGSAPTLQVSVREQQLPRSVWAAETLPSLEILPAEIVWIAPIQARKTHRLIQYAQAYERVLLVPASPANALPIADSPWAFRTFYRWHDVESALLSWTAGEARVWVSALSESVDLPANVERVQVSPRSSGAAAIDRLVTQFQSNQAGRIVNSWLPMLTWLDELMTQTALTPTQLTTWLPDLDGLAVLSQFSGIYGLTYYYYDLPDNDINDWLVRTTLERTGRLPTQTMVAGMASALALVAAWQRLDDPAEVRAPELRLAFHNLHWLAPQGEMRILASGETQLPFFRTRLRQQPQLEWARPVLLTGGNIVTHPQAEPPN